MSYPLIFGGTAAFMVWALYTGIPPWPTTLLIAIVSLFTIAALEQFQPFRQSWLEDHQYAYGQVIYPALQSQDMVCTYI